MLLDATNILPFYYERTKCYLDKKLVGFENLGSPELASLWRQFNTELLQRLAQCERSVQTQGTISPEGDSAEDLKT
jgi:hypothetical protein